MSGTLIAKSLKDTWPDKSVVVVEAREFCSGVSTPLRSIPRCNLLTHGWSRLRAETLGTVVRISGETS